MKAQKIMLALIVACFALLIAVLIYGVVALGGSADTTADGTSENTPAASSAPDTTPSVPDDTTAPENTSAPDTTQDTTVPETSAPVQYPPVSGSFTSALEVQLGVDVDWRTISRTDTEAEIEFTIVLNSYKIGIGARSNNYLKIGEHSYQFSTPKISITESGKKETVLAVLTARVPLTNGEGTFAASCSWSFKGTYSGVKFDNIVFDGVIEIK